jgi:hypothetical protein
MMIVERLRAYHGTICGASTQRRNEPYRDQLPIHGAYGADSHSEIRLPDDDSETTYQSMTENLNVRNKVRNPPNCKMSVV